MTIDELKSEVARLQEENLALNDTLALTIKFARSVVEQRDQEIKRLLAGDEYRASIIAEYRDRLEQCGALSFPEKPALELAAGASVHKRDPAGRAYSTRQTAQASRARIC